MKLSDVALVFELGMLILFPVMSIAVLASSPISCKGINYTSLNGTLDESFYNKTCCLKIFETGGFGSRGAKLYALKDVSGNYRLFLAALPVIGDYWCYKKLPWSYSIGIGFINKILVIEPNGTLEIYGYDVSKDKFVFLGKVPDNVSAKILKDIREGVYHLETPNTVRSCFRMT